MKALCPLLLACAGLGSAAAPAAEPPLSAVVRDPTVPPAAARAPAPSPAGAGAAGIAPGTEASALPRHLMVLDGKPYVIEHGWPRGVGDKLGEARIERIEGGAVWLRDASGSRPWSLYPGVEIRPAAAATPPATPPSGTSRAATRTRRAHTPATPATKDPLP